MNITKDNKATPQIIGMAGMFASGKDTLAEYLVETRGYKHLSTGDMVREIAQEKHGSIERPVLFITAKELRETEGPGALVIEALKKGQPIVITGIRSLGEMNEIHKAGGIMVFVDAPLEIRYERMRSRSRDKEHMLSIEEFAANEQKEWYGGPLDSDFNLRDIKQRADTVIDSSVPLEEFVTSGTEAIFSFNP